MYILKRYSLKVYKCSKLNGFHIDFFTLVSPRGMLWTCDLLLVRNAAHLYDTVDLKEIFGSVFSCLLS